MINRLNIGLFFAVALLALPVLVNADTSFTYNAISEDAEGVLDIDTNGEYDALTDGLLLLSGMFGLTDSAYKWRAGAECWLYQCTRNNL